jgi:NADPH-dependent 2,4-dienoyl-CoA reductase/sulfur reductase-like enzyme
MSATGKTWDVIVIGSGPGGLAAAIEAKKSGAQDVLIVERDVELGGILLQCIHNGFGVELFGEDLPGPTYAQKFIDEALDLGVETRLDTMVMDLTPMRSVFVTRRDGFEELQARAVVLAMGCRERTRPQIQIPGTRPAGVYTAGLAQQFVNIEGWMPGKGFVILGSGDIGMIMARRLTFEGARVERVLEVMPYLSGLMRNYVQCLLDFDIPLQLEHTVSRIIGRDRVEAVEAVQVDQDWRPIPGTEEVIPCDTLLLSVGLIPENELSRQAGVEIDPVTGGPYVNQDMETKVPGIFAAGNVVQVYDLVDWVTLAGYAAGRGAARFAIGQRKSLDREVRLEPGENVRHVVPHRLRKDALAERDVQLQMRVTRPIEERVSVELIDGREVVARQGARYARPGEMVTLRVKQEAYDAVNRAESLTVRVVERG